MRRFAFALEESGGLKGHAPNSPRLHLGFYRKRRYIETHSSSKGCRLCAWERCWQALERKRSRLAGRAESRRAVAADLEAR